MLGVEAAGFKFFFKMISIHEFQFTGIYLQCGSQNIVPVFLRCWMPSFVRPVTATGSENPSKDRWYVISMQGLEKPFLPKR